MNIKQVTITGADDSTNPFWIEKISSRYPFVEWGILVSLSSAGSPRFPSKNWINQLFRLVNHNSVNLSMHVCGRWVRDICKGNWDNFIENNCLVLSSYDRIQLNFHAIPHEVSDNFLQDLEHWAKELDVQFILQMDCVNNAIAEFANPRLVTQLFDISGGAGVVPSQWPEQTTEYCGYAGGLGPDNISTELHRIEQVTTGDIWLDMETKVRFTDNSALDPAAVESVLKQITAYKAEHQSGFLNR